MRRKKDGDVLLSRIPMEIMLREIKYKGTALYVHTRESSPRCARMIKNLCMQQSIEKKFFTASKAFCEDFSRLLKEQYSVNKISRLHTVIGHNRLLKKGTDQSTLLHKTIYESFDLELRSPLVRSYRALAIEWLIDLQNLYDIEEWGVQRYPSVRFHLPGNVSVFEFHRDSDYRHPLGEINHFLSITKSSGNAALHIEKNLGWDDYKPLELEEGESAIVNTSIFKHGDYINTQNYTRVSVDFRAIPIRILESQDRKESLTKGLSLDCSSYFIDSRELIKEQRNHGYF